ncbi:CaiB/BaiF CoA transferase family protein [Pseudofrankia inefficax]|uniref:L-carnitine dehydratase/bile acid-inducible protein F n=1 Tax=Pseudofrankia inefficax (strain DSM 45817 / CECT 9037 / DDB 130130 / EuI1c) TaxID=298654 RepID=E3IWR6_PSEI1|nr:CoA transferase [Pseudofrankia inefficax]ADP81396.1 L-carnitine dehydratase/bile acid-inducible protein F [Pseudofrankia inefficax]
MTLPLTGVRIVELTDGLADGCGRYLADLGAEVVKVEPPGGAASRRAGPRPGDSLPFLLRNANKLGVVLDLETPAGRDRLRELVSRADIVVESAPPGHLDALGVGPRDLLAGNPGLVVVSVTGFGRTGPYRSWSATEAVLAGLGGVLSRSGRPGEAPLLPPDGLVESTVAVLAAWSALVAYAKRLRTGVGELVDLAAFEAVVHGFDPAFGTQGTAAAGRTEDFPRGRPDAADFYPVFAARDGHVRLCLLAKRQWRAMFGWLGEPPEFADPRFDTIPARFRAADRLHPRIAALFRDRPCAELVAEGARRGVPVAAVLTPAQVLATEQFAVTGALVDVEIAPGIRARIPSGYVRVDGERAGFRRRAPLPGEHDDLVFGSAAGASGADGPAACARGAARGGPAGVGARPLEGVRVLDLGVIVFGAELGRLFADQGADVIKIENVAFPDGLRQSRGGAAMSASFAWGHRNRRGLGLDLRDPRGSEIFRALVARSDLVLANFKPGTLEALGASPNALAAINPGVIVSDSSAFGGQGPWSARMGYGPLVRACAGVSALWRVPGTDDAYCDGSTVYPDHVAAYASAVALLAALIGRLRSAAAGGVALGATVTGAQVDAALVALGARLAAQSLAGDGGPEPDAGDHLAADDAIHGVYPCAGDDEWCVVSLRGDDDWLRLCQVAGRPDLADAPAFRTAAARARRRPEVDAVVAAWTRRHPPRDVMTRLQDAGVPAGVMLRLPEELTDPQLLARESFATLRHDALPGPMAANARVARFSGIPDPELRPAPFQGEHTREICASLLGLADDQIDELVRDAVLQPAPDDPALRAAASAGIRRDVAMRAGA